MNEGLMDRLIRESDVPDRIDAIGRPFFMGKTIFVSDTDPIGKVVHESAFTDQRIRKRLEDPQFCRFCFFYIGEDSPHDYRCRKSPWNFRNENSTH